MIRERETRNEESKKEAPSNVGAGLGGGVGGATIGMWSKLVGNFGGVLGWNIVLCELSL